MNGQEVVDGMIADSTRSLIGVVNDSLTGHARHAADLASRAADPNSEIDPMAELTAFWNRAIRDGVRFFESMSLMLQLLGSDPVPIPEKVEAAPNPNSVKTTILGAATNGRCQPQGLRRRGESNLTISASKIRVTRNATDSSQLDLVIEAGGAPRGLYEGTVTVGSAGNATPVNYNVYVDW